MARGKDVREVMDAMTSPEGLKITGEGGVTDYNDLDNLPKVNSVELKGNKTLAQLGIQEELTAGDNITISGGVISATPTDLSDYAKKEDVYDKDAADAKFQELLHAGDNIVIDTTTNTISAEQPDVSGFAKATSVYLKTEADVKFQDKLTAGSNITIDANNEISATQPDLTPYALSADVYDKTAADAKFQEIIHAGDNIVIDTTTNTISAEQPDLTDYVKTTSVYLKSEADIKFQESLSAGYGIDATDLATNQVSVKVDGTTVGFNANGELVANAAGGDTVVEGDGISITTTASGKEISAKLAAGANVTLNTESDGTITIGAAGGSGGTTTISAGDGVAVTATASGYEVAADPDGTTIGIDTNGKLKSLVSGGTTYGAGDAIDIDGNDDINVKVDGTTIHVNASNELEVIGGGGGTTYGEGTAIEIDSNDDINVKIDGTTITTNASGELQAVGGGGTTYTAGNGIDISTTVSGDVISTKVDNNTIGYDSNQRLEAKYAAGNGINITTTVNGPEISTKVDNSTIGTNASGQIEFIGAPVMPSGVIVPYGGATAPTGWLLCNGTEVSKTTYAELYAVIGDSFGTASDSSHFVLPDLREATTKGVGLSGKSNNHYDSDGVALGEFVEDRVQDHTHGLAQKAWTAGGEGGVNLLSVGSSHTSSYGTDLIRDARYGDTTEVKAVGVNYIIKA